MTEECSSKDIAVTVHDSLENQKHNAVALMDEKVYTGEVPSMWKKRLVYECAAEAIGTLILVIGGVGSVNCAVAVGTHQDLWHSAIMWGFSLALAIYCTASVSGGHLNPAVSFALALTRKFAWWKVGWYSLAQLVGAMIGALINFAVYGNFIAMMEKEHEIKRGDAGSERSAMVFGEYFPNPAWSAGIKENYGIGDSGIKDLVSPLGAFLCEAWGTAVLMFVILAVTDKKQKVLARKELGPLLIGLTLAVLTGLYAPLTQSGYNPARDFGARLIAVFGGWGTKAIPGPRNGFWVYILGPVVGASASAFSYVAIIEKGLEIVDLDDAMV